MGNAHHETVHRYAAHLWVGYAHRAFRLLSFALLSTLIASCAKEVDRAEGGGRLRVVCTTGMIADAAVNVGGNRVAVTALMGEGVDPHLYKASTGDMQRLSTADLILYNGLHLEGRMADQFEHLAKKRPTAAVTDTIGEERLRTLPGTDAHDPHVWFDVSLWMKAVERTRDALIQVDAAGKEAYTKNTEEYLARLNELHTETRERIAGIPRESRVLITAHDAFGYFGRAYDIEVMGLQGISTESEPSLKDVNVLVDRIVGRKVKAVFVESSVAPKNIEALVEGCRARGHEVRIGGQLFSDAMGRAGTPEGTYIGMVRHNVHTIVEALR